MSLMITGGAAVYDDNYFILLLGLPKTRKGLKNHGATPDGPSAKIWYLKG